MYQRAGTQEQAVEGRLGSTEQAAPGRRTRTEGLRPMQAKRTDPARDVDPATLPAGGGGTLVRGALHQRPVDAYQRLLVLERTEAGYRRGNSLGAQATTAWRWVEHHKAPVWVDVAIDRVTPHGATAPQRAFETQQSGVRFATRGVSHVQVVRLRARDRGLDLYRAQSFPHTWVHDARLIDGAPWSGPPPAFARSS